MIVTNLGPDEGVISCRVLVRKDGGQRAWVVVVFFHGHRHELTPHVLHGLVPVPVTEIYQCTHSIFTLSLIDFGNLVLSYQFIMLIYNKLC